MKLKQMVNQTCGTCYKKYNLLYVGYTEKDPDSVEIYLLKS